jgi:hypothetical protein
MKKLFLFATMLLSAMAISLTSCKDPVPEPDPTPKPEPPGPTPVELTFDVEIEAVTKSSMTYSVIPSIKDVNYLVVLVPETYIDQAGMGEGLSTAIMESLRNQAASTGKTLAEYLPEVMSKGDINSKVMTGLAPETDYSLVVFGLDAELKPNTEPVCEPFTTEAVQPIDCSFDVAVEVLGTKASFEVTPSNNDINWHMFIIADADYNAYVDPAGEYKFTDGELFAAYFDSEIQSYLQGGFTMAEIIAGLCPKGTVTMEAKNLNANFTYRYMIAGVLVEGDSLYIVTAPSHNTFTTGEPLSSDMTFEISVENVEMNRVDLKITPSKLDETFTWVCGTYDGTSSEVELMNKWVNDNKMFLDWGMLLYQGVQDYTAGGPNYKYKLSAPDTDHYVMAVGYAGGITTEPAVAFFRTLPAPDPADATFTVTQTSAEPWGANFTVDCSDETSYYNMLLAEQGAFNREIAILEAENGLQELLSMQQMFNPGATMLDILSSYYWSGDVNNGANGLEPEKSYTLAILVFSKEGKVVGVHEFDGVLTTTAVGALTPEIELIGYYSGNDENGELFGQPAATKDRVIAAVRYNVPEGATALYTYSSYPSSHPATMTSPELFYSFWNYTTEVSLEMPYQFFVMDWDTDNIIWATVRDANNLLGEFVNGQFTTTPEGKGDYADLKALIQELNGKSGVLTRPAGTKKEGFRLGEPMLKKSTVEPLDIVPESIAAPEMTIEIAAPEMEFGAIRQINVPWFVRVC